MATSRFQMEAPVTMQATTLTMQTTTNEEADAKFTQIPTDSDGALRTARAGQGAGCESEHTIQSLDRRYASCLAGPGDALQNTSTYTVMLRPPRWRRQKNLLP